MKRVRFLFCASVFQFGFMAVAVGDVVLITNDTTLTWADSALYTNDDVTVTSNAVLTLGAHATYGTLVEYHFNNLTLTNGATMLGKGQSVSPYNGNARGVAIMPSSA